MTFPERWVKEVLRGTKDNPWHNRIHVIKGLTYRQAISWDGFFSYKHTRNHVQYRKHFFKDFFEVDYKIALDQNENMKHIGFKHTFEWIEHEDLYTFYDYIGYNRKTKKFER